MKPSTLTFHRPQGLDEAVTLLDELGEHAKVLAGGQSLVPLLSMRLAAPAHLVDINDLPGLADVHVDGTSVTFGALVRHSDLLAHEGARAAQPLLARALSQVAHATIRNRGTTVGSIVHSDPSAEMPAVLTLLSGSVRVRSAAGERVIAAGDLFAGPLESSLAPGEIALSATVPVRGPGEGTAIVEVARRHGDYAVLGVVVQVVVAEDVVAAARACYVSAGELGTVVDLGEPVLGSAAEGADWAACAELAASVVQTDGDIHATARYRSQLVRVLTSRALHTAAADAVSGGRQP